MCESNCDTFIKNIEAQQIYSLNLKQWSVSYLQINNTKGKASPLYIRNDLQPDRMPKQNQKPMHIFWSSEVRKPSSEPFMHDGSKSFGIVT